MKFFHSTSTISTVVHMVLEEAGAKPMWRDVSDRTCEVEDSRSSISGASPTSCRRPTARSTSA